MERSSSWEADSHSAGQVILRVLFNPKVHPWHVVYLLKILILSSHLQLDLVRELFPTELRRVSSVVYFTGSISGCIAPGWLVNSEFRKDVEGSGRGLVKYCPGILLEGL
jgi:hypothetical protein